jgi:hypothetical protein
VTERGGPDGSSERRRRVLAELRHDGGLRLVLRDEVLAIDALPQRTLDRLARLKPPLLVEADVEGTRVVGIGSMRPHPRVAALRAVADTRHDDALESLAILGDGIEDDLELLHARLRAFVGVGRVADAESDFAKICAHPHADAEAMARAFEALPAVSTDRCGARLATRIVEVASSDPEPSYGRLLRGVPLAHWPTDALFRGIDEELSSQPDQFDLDDAAKLLAAASDRAPSDARLEPARARIEAATRKLADREHAAAAKLLAARPDFAEVEALFGVALPPHLRSAWEAHYEGRTVGFGFFEVLGGKLAKLTALARALERDLAEELRGPTGPQPHRLLPFAVGEHENEYFALDLAAPTTTGDFAVLVLFLGGAEGWVAYPSSAAWIAADGITRHT